MDRARAAGYLVAALGIAGAITVFLSRWIPRHLDVRTDSLGFPTRYNFNIFRQWYIYGLLAFVLPMATLLVYMVLTRRRRTPAPTDPTTGSNVELGREPPTSSDGWPVPLRTSAPHVLRIATVGCVLGLELSVAPQNDTRSSTAVFAIAVVSYTAGVLGLAFVARLLRDPRPRFWTSASLVNAAGSALCVVGLYGVSRTTQVSIASAHAIRKVPWMPLELAGSIAAFTVIGLVLYLRRQRSTARIWKAERWMILLVAFPAAFVVLHARIPGALGSLSSFEDGQLLVGAHQVLHGAFPWRDIILTHGILNDALLFMPGLVFFEVSRWGALAGYDLFVEPVYWLLLYGLVLYLTRGRWAYPALFLAIVVLGDSFLGGFFSQVVARFLPLPLILISFGLLLQRSTWPRTVAFTGGLLVLVVLTPEAFFLIPISALVLVLFEVSTRPVATRIRISSFPRVLRCLVVGVVGCGLVAAWLAWNNALGAFTFYYRTFVPAHLLEGIPIESTHQQIFFAAMYVPIVLAILYLGSMAAAVWTRRRPRNEDWVGSILAAGTVLYYAKFLGRADQSHLFQVLAFTTPFLFYLLYRVVDGIQIWLAGRGWHSQSLRTVGRYAVTSGLIVGVLIPSAGDLVNAVQHVPRHFTPTVSAPATVSRVGYAKNGVASSSEFSDLRRILLAVGGPRARVWDFSNSPAIMYFIEGFDPPTRYDNISIAIRSSTQRDVISELRRDHPDVIMYDSSTGLTSWDGLPNMVRHYDVSAWLLRNYRPVVSYLGNVIYAAKSTHVSLSALENLNLAEPLDMTTDLYTDAVSPCDWGYVPNFFVQQPEAGPPSRVVPLIEAGRHEIVTGRLTRGATDASVPVQVFATSRGMLLASGRIDETLSVFPSGIGFGFEIDVPLGARTPGEVSAWVRTADGTVQPVLTSTRGASTAVGTIEAALLVWEDQFTIPTDAADYHWIELMNRSGASLPADSFALSRANDYTHGIYFSTRSGAPRPFVVRVDNCSQWAAMPGASATLVHTQRQAGIQVQLRR